MTLRFAALAMLTAGILAAAALWLGRAPAPPRPAEPAAPAPRTATLPDRTTPPAAAGTPVPGAGATARPRRSPEAEARRSEDETTANAAGSDASPVDPVDASFVEEWGEPSPELVRRAFEQALAESFDDYRLSSDEIERASSALYRLREARLALAELPMGPETAERRRTLVETIQEATEAFSDVMEMDPAAFTARADADAGTGGIDRGADPDYVPDADYLERRR